MDFPHLIVIIWLEKHLELIQLTIEHQKTRMKITAVILLFFALALVLLTLLVIDDHNNGSKILDPWSRVQDQAWWTRTYKVGKSGNHNKESDRNN